MIRPNQIALGYGAAMAAGVVGLGFTPAAFAIPTLGVMALLGDGIFRPGSSILMPTVTHGPRSGKRIALTFDDGPDPEVTPQILDLLKRHNAKATFYCIAKHCEQHPELTRRIVAEGHELGNHSYEHSRTLNFRGADFQEQEIEKANQVLREFAPAQRQITYRPPVGLKNPPLAKVIKKLGMPVIAWSIHSRDTRMTDPAAITTRVMNKIKNGDIILMHDGHDLPGQSRPATVEAVKNLLEALTERNIESVSVATLKGY